MTVRRRLAGLAATLAILAFVAGVPTLLVWAYGRLGTLTWSELWVRAQMPDDGTLVLVLLQVVAWIAWGYLTWGLVLEVVFRVRAMPAPRLRGLGLSQGAARHLIDAAAVLFVVVPVTAPLVAAPAHAVTSASTGPAPAVASAPLVALPAPPVAEPVETAAPTPATFEYTVKRNESLWKIAERFLGHGTAWTQIRDLNLQALGDNPSYIEPGMVLRIPTIGTDSPDGGTYVVEPGDTLSGIAQRKLGDAGRYREIFEASTSTVQPDGERLTDPDLIRPGWTVTIPGTTAGSRAATATSAARSGRARPAPVSGTEQAPAPPSPVPPSPVPTSAVTPTPEPLATAPRPLNGSGLAATAPAPETPREPADAAPSGRATTDAPPAGMEASPTWLVPGLAGAGGILAGALLLTIRARRRTAARRRETGMMLPPLPPELQPTARTAAYTGATPSEAVACLTGMLAALAGETTDPERLPRVVTAVVAGGEVTLTLGEDASLPSPWSGAGTTWTAPLTPTPVVAGDAPYPLLVPVGADTDGRVHLVNLEHLGTLGLTGDDDRVIAFARFLASSVALNPWSARVCVYALGVAEELADIDHLRLQYFGPEDSSGIEEAVHAATIGTALASVPDNRLLVLTTGSGDREHELATAIASHQARPAVVLVALGSNLPGATHAAITATGRLVIADLGIDVTAPGLSRDEAAACAQVVAATDAATSVPIPVDDDAGDGWETHANLAGALRPELVTDRPRDASAPAGSASLLPDAAASYVDFAPVTADDVAVLAPLVRDGVRSAVEEDLDDLDRDLADFGRTPARRPWIRLLGPVEGLGCGDRHAAPYRDATRLETFAYLALHPKGATAAELRDAGIAGTSTAQRATELRTWLGRNPATGTPYLPNAHHSPDHGKSGLVYRLEDCLCDVSLFRALRVRGEARGGEAGIADLVAALRLVEGEPFAQAPGHFSWVFEGERLDHVMTIAVLEVASVVIAHALAVGDLATARLAAEAAHRAAPDDDQAKLDLVAVAAREGHGGKEVQHMLDAVGVTSTDYRSPIDPSDRTQEIIEALRSSARSGG
ncbi:MAG: LysM peptidoglycan-binding domain-containing protein [Promicromonosporaceae bacterium]|nr:LysM peptidoglycan-binding domain-containing protein [Promicromonosporaceae bacterium]